MKKPVITNKNCRSPWTFGHRIREWEVLFEDEPIRLGVDEVEVALVLVEGRDIFITVENSDKDTLIEPNQRVLKQLRIAKKAVGSLPRFRWKFPRVTCFVVVDDRKLDVTGLL